MIYSVIVDDISSEIEEEVSLLIQGKKITCFASCVPYQIEVGKSYFVCFDPMVFNGYSVQEVFSDQSKILRIGDSYSYIFTGRLIDGCLDVGLFSIFDEIFLSEFFFLDQKMVSWKVDRLDVVFCELSAPSNCPDKETGGSEG